MKLFSKLLCYIDTKDWSARVHDEYRGCIQQKNCHTALHFWEWSTIFYEVICNDTKDFDSLLSHLKNYRISFKDLKFSTALLKFDQKFYYILWKWIKFCNFIAISK